ncbi:MAG: DUF3592 domain-containing protein [Phycisphaeraceae bacterium]|nr:DUF3592 domain-containing protein [Phycisphaerales bacterium]MCB9859679.1 DUF3592 domain-containing protein [Phycisphaeraceae bacterium]
MNAATRNTLLAIAGLCPALGFGTSYIAQRSHEWVETEGVIYGVMQYGLSDKKRNRLEYLYMYEHDGVTRTSKRWNPLTNEAGGWPGMVKRYNEGDTVTVYMDRNDPTYTVLETGIAQAEFFCTAIGLFLAVGVISEEIYQRRQNKRSVEHCNATENAFDIAA